MRGTIFAETLKRHMLTMLYWGIGLGLLTWVQIVALPDAAALQQMGDLLETLPAWMIEPFFGTDMAYIATPEGYVAAQYFAVMLVLLGAYAVFAGMNVSANEEEKGILDVSLSLPVSRTQFLAERLAAFVLLTLCVVALSYAGLWLGVVMTPAMSGLDLNRMFSGMLNMVPGMLLVLTFTVLLGAVFARRSYVMGGAWLFLLGSYFLDLVAKGAPGSVFNQLSAVSFFHYYDGIAAVRDGLNPTNVGILGGAALLCVVLAFVAFPRRDVGV